jgi:pimeloyl-ACP methyl ester carboxylesterase
MNEFFVETNGLRLHVVGAGPADGPLVVLLHGFPEFWYGWRHQIHTLAAAGYRVWAPDQRGYHRSDKPAGVAAYAVRNLVADVLGLVDAAGCEKALVVGHDWGAAVAWWLALWHPERVSRLVILNVPHPAVMGRTLLRRPRQLLKSWYILFFQVPGLPEALLRLGGSRLLRRTLRRTSRSGTFSAADLDRYAEAWAKRGALRAMVNWYRAAARYPAPTGPNPRITVPTLLLWGKLDAFLIPDMAPASLACCDDGRLVFFENATHWVQHEEAEAVNGHLLRFFAEA